jgi:hypothetical protein
MLLYLIFLRVRYLPIDIVKKMFGGSFILYCIAKTRIILWSDKRAAIILHALLLMVLAESDPSVSTHYEVLTIALSTLKGWYKNC